jgi:hypothetical protein
MFFKKKPPLRQNKVIFFQTPVKKPVRRRKPISWKFVFATLCFVFLALFFSPLFFVKNFDIVRSTFAVNTEEIQEELTKRFISKHIVFLSKEEVQIRLQEKFPQWKNFLITKQYPDTLVVDIIPFSPFAKVFASFSVNEEETDEKKEETGEFMINEEGRLTYEDYGVFPEFIIEYKEVLEEVPSVGDFFVSPNDIEFLRRSLEIVQEEFGSSVKKIEYFKNGREFRIDTFQYVFWLYTKLSPEEQFNKFLYALPVLKEKSLEYIDLRIANRIIYKPKNAE